MLPINLEGEALWERQKYLNKITNEAFASNKKLSDVKGLEELSDVDRLFKIDLANKERNVDYILENLKSLDSLYVARALRADWLFSNDEFSDVVKPGFLESNVFPQMAPKTVGKFLLKLRIHLKNPKRCEEFFEHYEDTNKQLAFGFLLHCSEDFLISLKERYTLHEIEPELLKRLSRNRPQVAESFFSTAKSNHGHWDHITAIKHLVTTHGETFLNILEKYHGGHSHYYMKLGTRVCSTIIKNHKQRILAKPSLYDGVLKWDMLKENLNENEIKAIARELVTNEAENFFHKNILFMKYAKLLKKEIIYSFAKEVFSEKWPDKEFELSEGFYDHNWHNEYLTEEQREQWALQHIAANTDFLVDTMFKLYAYVSFDLAFPELTKLIRSEKSSEARHKYFEVLISSSRLDQDAIYRLMNYYVQKHLNEPVNFRGSFISDIANKKLIYNFNEKCWSLISQLFNSIRLFEDPSEYAISVAIEGAILYYIINGIEIPENVKFKFFNKFSTMAYVQGTVSQENEQKIYDFLYTKMANSIKDYYIFDQNTLYTLLIQHFKLIHSWKRKLTDYPELVTLVKRIINNGYHGYQFYQRNLSGTNDYDEVFAQELLKHKHIPAASKIIKVEKNVLSTKSKLDIQSLIRDLSTYYSLLSKVRIYFKKDLWIAWVVEIKEYFNTWQTSQNGIDEMVTALFWLLDSKDAENFFESFLPEGPKMDSSNQNFSSVQKFVAKHMHLARPTISFEFVSAFLKGDYMKYATPPLNSWCSQVPQLQVEGAIKIIIDSPVSIQKHGIRLALKRLRVDQIKPLFEELYRQTKNISIKEVIFNSTYFILTRKQKLPNISDWAELLKSFIDSLSGNDDRSIYTYINKLDECPVSVQPMLCEASWKCMLRAPDNSLNRSFKETLLPLIEQNIDEINEICLHDILHDYFTQTLIEEKSILTKEWFTLDTLHWRLAENYLIKCKTSEIQDERIANILSLIITGSLNLWHELKEDKYIVKQKFNLFLDALYRSAFYHSRGRDEKYTNPSKIFHFIDSKLEELLPSIDVFYRRTTFKLIVMLIDALHAVRNESGDIFSTLEEADFNVRIYENVFTKFGSSCGKFFENWKAEYFSLSNEMFYKCIRLFLEVFKRHVGIMYTHVYFVKGFIAEGGLDHLEVSLRLIPEDISVHRDMHKSNKYFEDVKAAYLQIINEMRRSDCAAIHILLDMKFNDGKKREFQYSPQSTA